LLRPKSEIDLTQMGEPMSVTMINTHQLPNYSTERFYMLSELEIKAHSTLFLCDYQEDEETQDTAESSISEEHAPFPSKHTTMPSHAILYLLWRPDQTSSIRAFADGHILAAIQHYNSLVETMSGSSHLYLVVDIVAIHPNKDDDDDTDGAKQKRHFQVAVHTCETLCRHVAQSFRCLLEGITVGISNHVRAAPGLDACVDAISVGARDRRQFVSRDEKSPVGLVALHPHDLLGLQHESSEQVTDAVQGVLQSQTCAEWNGNGNLVTFARRAHSAWCVAHHVTEHKSSTSCTRKERKRRNVLDDGDVSLAQPGKAFCILFLFGLLASHLWQKYEDSMLDNTTNVPPDELDTTWETSDP
jgi:hypothetical protein